MEIYKDINIEVYKNIQINILHHANFRQENYFGSKNLNCFFYWGFPNNFKGLLSGTEISENVRKYVILEMTRFHLTENTHFLQYRNRTNRRCVGFSFSLSYPLWPIFPVALWRHHGDVTAALTSPPLPYVTIQNDLVSLSSNFALSDSSPPPSGFAPRT